MDESIRIPIEIDDSQGLAALSNFGKSADQTAVKVRGIGTANFNPLEERIKHVASAQHEFARITGELPSLLSGASGGTQLLGSEMYVLATGIQRAREAGQSMGSIFKQLGASLFTVQGVILAGVGLLSFFGEKLFGAGKEAHATAEKLKELIRPIEEIKSEAAAGTEQELAKILALSNAVQDQTKSYAQRNDALNQLKKINENYFGDLTLESSKLSTLKDRVNEYSEAIINQAIIKAFSDDIGKLAVELSKQEKAFNDANKAVIDNRKLLSQSKGDDYFFQSIKVNDATTAFDKQAKVVGKLRDQMGNLRTAIQDAVNVSLDLKPLTGDKTVKPKINAEKIIVESDVLIKARLQTVELLPTDDSALKAAQKAFEERAKNLPQIVAKVPFKIELSDFDKYLAAIKTKIDNLRETIKNAIGGAFEIIGESIGEALSGTSGGFKKIFSFMGTLIQEIGKALIQYGIVKTGLDKVLKAGIALPGAAAIAIGIGAIAIGQLVKTAGSKIHGFAAGGLVTGPILAQIGEGVGTSRANPEVVAPLNQLKNFFADMIGNRGNGLNAGRNVAAQLISVNMPDEVIVRQQGADLVGVIALQTKRNNRGG